MIAVALIGASGYVGRGLQRALGARDDVRLTPVTRATYDAARRGDYDIVVNAAMPAARWRARQDPMWDFGETVAKTAWLLHGWSAARLVQISSISARTETDTVYGRHKAAAEQLCRLDRDLVVRIGAMYSNDLEKGVLTDMLAGRKVWVDGSSRYCFAPRDWVAGWIAANLDRTGVVEIGARDAIALRDVAACLGRPVAFEGRIDHQEVDAPDPSFPAAADVVRWLRTRAAAARVAA